MEQPSPVGTPFGRSESQGLRTLTSKDPELEKEFRRHEKPCALQFHAKSVFQANP